MTLKSFATSVLFLILYLPLRTLSCSPVAEGSTVVLTCNDTDQHLELLWKQDDQIVSRCNQTNLCDPDLYVTTRGHGVSVLTVPDIQRTNQSTTWSCFYNDGSHAPFYICSLQIYFPPSLPVCTKTVNAHTANNTSIKLTCTTGKVFPQAHCEFYLKTPPDRAYQTVESATTQHDGIFYTTATQSNVTQHSPTYYTTTCVLELNVTGSQKGDWHLYVQMYPGPYTEAKKNSRDVTISIGSSEGYKISLTVEAVGIGLGIAVILILSTFLICVARERKLCQSGTDGDLTKPSMSTKSNTQDQHTYTNEITLKSYRETGAKDAITDSLATEKLELKT